MDQKEVDEKLRLHKLWLDEKPGGARADFSEADLRDFCFDGLNLSSADFYGTCLEGMVFKEVELQDASFDKSNLQGACFENSNLQGVLFDRSNLQNASFKNSILEEVSFCKAILQGVSFKGSSLKGADFDFSCFPLSCGGSYFICDERLIQQFFAHICTLDVLDASDDMKKAINAIRGEAKKSHRAKDLGLI